MIDAKAKLFVIGSLQTNEDTAKHDVMGAGITVLRCCGSEKMKVSRDLLSFALGAGFSFPRLVIALKSRRSTRWEFESATFVLTVSTPMPLECSLKL